MAWRGAAAGGQTCPSGMGTVLVTVGAGGTGCLCPPRASVSLLLRCRVLLAGSPPCLAGGRIPPPRCTMASRIGLRMELMKQQAQQEAERERMQQQMMMNYMQQQRMPVASTPAINTPVHYQSPPPVPGEVLKVQCWGVPATNADEGMRGPLRVPDGWSPPCRSSPTWKTPPRTTCRSHAIRRFRLISLKPMGTSLLPTSAPSATLPSHPPLPPLVSEPATSCPPRRATARPTAPWPCSTSAPTPSGR